MFYTISQSVHELSQSDKHSERCGMSFLDTISTIAKLLGLFVGFGAINIFCSPSNISTSIEKFSSGDFLIVELEPPTISPQNKVPSSQNRQRSVTIDAAAEPDNQRNFFEPEEGVWIDVCMCTTCLNMYMFARYNYM